MADPQVGRDERDPSRDELDQLDFDHHREERRRLLRASAVNQRISGNDRTRASNRGGWRHVDAVLRIRSRHLADAVAPEDRDTRGAKLEAEH